MRGNQCAVWLVLVVALLVVNVVHGKSDINLLALRLEILMVRSFTQMFFWNFKSLENIYASKQNANEEKWKQNASQIW